MNNRLYCQLHTCMNNNFFHGTFYEFHNAFLTRTHYEMFMFDLMGNFETRLNSCFIIN